MSELRPYPDTLAFIEAALPYWQAHPVLCNLQWALSKQYAATGQLEKAFILYQDGQIHAIGIQTDPPRPLILQCQGKLTGAQVRQVEQFLGKPIGLIATTTLAKDYLAGSRYAPIGELGLVIYELGQLSPDYALAGGVLKLATLQDLDWLTPWMQAFLEFIEEIGGENDYRNRAIQLIEKKQLYVYFLAGQPVSMAASTRSCGGVAAINYVFTPPELRGKGYSPACVGALCETLLQAHTHCVLFADADYPSSNAVYRKLGFHQVGTSVEITF
ncbi:MAG: GNAT family N-acetyltransferase [Bacteroidota bacterium]